MKRSSNQITPPNPPPSKQARQEHPSRQDEVQSPSRSLTVSEKTIKSLRSALQDISVSTPDWKEEIYFVIRAGLRKSVLKGSEGKARADNASLEESWAIATHTVLSRTNPESQEKALLEHRIYRTSSTGGPETHIRDQMKLVETYARYCSIVQSSGMGKSHLLDELSKKHFMIPINCAQKMPEVCHFHFTFMVLKPGLLGFPPADDVVRDFLTHVDKKNKNMHVLSLSRANHFFHALFLTTAEVVADFLVRSRAERIQRFRAFMSEDQSMSSSRPKRSQFYKDVITKATKVLLYRSGVPPLLSKMPASEGFGQVPIQAMQI
ncbi:hypothetical protein EDB87DRAFT_1582551 [Lactarius vividus]|nr:hypothetical protein EDB87DRAFT_1582551 [Lactarius vividus]